MKLYEISNEYAALIEYLTENPDDEIEDIDNILNTLNDEFEVKADNIARVVQSVLSDIDDINNEIKRLQNRKKQFEKSVDKLKDYLKNNMVAMDKKKFKTPLFSFTVALNPAALHIAEDAKIPKKYMIPQPAKIDNTAIKNDLKLGKKINGCSLVQSESLRIK